MWNCSKLFLLSAVLIAVNSYRIEERLKSDLENLVQDVAEMEALKDEFVDKRALVAECKYSGFPCHNVYSYGCREGVCWRQCYSNTKTWCILKDKLIRGGQVRLSCNTHADCKSEQNRRILGGAAKNICEKKSWSELDCQTSLP
ncbi:uncharacterized protein [Clytia hemisphaerica]|uniref:Uncharacterized protein n=1 Tax=Clytia hemisphaerica TaxID=252671 RepID=A0A7M5XN13_9CNID